jgi:hypothetical protein
MKDWSLFITFYPIRRVNCRYSGPFRGYEESKIGRLHCLSDDFLISGTSIAK